MTTKHTAAGVCKMDPATIAAKLNERADLLVALRLCVDFMENCTDEDPQRSEKFFACREAWRVAFAKATS